MGKISVLDYYNQLADNDHAMKNYDIQDFLAQFPNNEACLDYVVRRRFPDMKFPVRIPGRTSFRLPDKSHFFPLVGTLFSGSRIPVIKWFFAIFLFANSRNSISAKEMHRQLGISPPAAWSLCSRLRTLMKQDENIKLSGIVEADETYLGGTRRLDSWKKSKVPIVGLLERDGRVVAKALSGDFKNEICPFVEKHLEKGSTLYTDSSELYNALKGFKRGKVVHTDKEYVRGKVHTNNIEAFWSHFKRSTKGTHISIKKKHVQSYIDAAVFRWNVREGVFQVLMDRALGVDK